MSPLPDVTLNSNMACVINFQFVIALEGGRLFLRAGTTGTAVSGVSLPTVDFW
jgi:hypothetical protein